MTQTFTEKRFFEWHEDDCSVSLRAAFASYGGGSEVLVIDRIQTVTGTLSPGGHPGSYNGQDAYNDMLVVDNESNKRRERTTESVSDGRESRSLELYARSTGSINRGGANE